MNSTLREEIDSLRDYISGFPEWFATSASGVAYQLRLEQLCAELEAEPLVELARSAHVPALELRMNGSRTEGGKISAAFLGGLLQEWQSLTWALAQAATGRPTTRGQIPREITEQSNFDVVAFAPGSFVARLVVTTLEQESMFAASLATQAVVELEALISVGSSHDKLTLTFTRLGGRVLSSYVRVLRMIEEWDSTLSVTFAEPEDGQVLRMSMSPAMAREILPALKYVSAQSVSAPIVVVGTLEAANLRSHTFEIDAGEDGTYSGRILSESVASGAVLGRLYEANLVELVSTDPMTRLTTNSWLLNSLTPLESA